MQTYAFGKLGKLLCKRYISLNISLFAHLKKHCCENKICFPGSKNVSRQIQLSSTNHVSTCFLTCFKYEKNCFPNQRKQCINTRANFSKILTIVRTNFSYKNVS